ncbi:MAG: DASH family cryptochrome [Idiomarina sp.]|nr:DASH family cryptochrome [Idiomarina sp.]
MSALVWLRRNLRLDNNPAILSACETSEQYFVFCYDKQYTGQWLGIPRMSAIRSSFLWQSLCELNEALEARGGRLIVLVGEPDHVLPELAQTLGCTQVESQALFAWEEQQQEQRVEHALASQQITLRLHQDYSLFQNTQVTAAMGKPLTSFSQFRRHFEQQLHDFHLQPSSSPSSFHSVANNYDSISVSPVATADGDQQRAVMKFQGGRAAGLQRLKQYVSYSGPIRHYKDTRNELLGADFSSKLSPWLNLGCLTPEEVISQVNAHEAEAGENPSTHWLKIEVLWREFFQHLAMQRGSELFLGDAKVAEVTRRHASFAQWSQGALGQRFVDANMRELLATGYMSNRGRQNTASALIHDLALDWRLGAAWFESHLIDYDPAANYGNWQYIAGLAANPRGGSWFNLEKQAHMYDPEDRYTNHWLKSN